RQVFAPVVFDALVVLHFVHAQRVQALGHRVVVVVQPLLGAARRHADVRIHRVVFLNPPDGGFHANVVFANTGVDQAFDTGVGHAPVAGLGAVHLVQLRLAATGRTVDEAAVVGLGGPGLILEFTLEVLATAYELLRFLEGFVFRINTSGLEGFEGHLRV